MVTTSDGDMPALMWLPATGNGPGLVMVQEIFGLSPYIQARAADLAQLGYLVLAPELYWRLPDHEIDEHQPNVLDRAMSLAGRVDWNQVVSDTASALRSLRERTETGGVAGLIGFCFGGGVAFNVAAVEKPDVLVSYYGSALPGLLGLADQVTAPSLHHFGLSDAYIGRDEIERIRNVVMASPGTVFETYEGAGHAFDNPSPGFHHPAASNAAWQTTMRFLARELPISDD